MSTNTEGNPMQDQTYPVTKPIVLTEGFSPKAVLAFFFPLIPALLAVAVQWIASGDFDRAELATTLSGFGASALAGLGAYLGNPGTLKTIATTPLASDALLAKQLSAGDLATMQKDLDDVPTREPANEGDKITGESGFVTYDMLAILLAVIGVVLIVWGHLLFGIIVLAIALFAVIGSRGFTRRSRF